MEPWTLKVMDFEDTRPSALRDNLLRERGPGHYNEMKVPAGVPFVARE
jgi:hypothetical protein